MAVSNPMADIDLSGWLIVAVRVDDVADGDELAALAGAVTSALERRRPFGLVIASAAPVHDATGTPEPLRWLRRRRAEIGTWCRGVVYVLPGTAALRFGATERGAAQRLWGCEVEVVPDPQAARVWLLGRLDPHADP